MNLQTAIIEWQRLAPNARPVVSTTDLSDEIASSFRKTVAATHCPDLRYIDLLCGMADSPDPELSEAATESLYRTVIEGLCDDFTDHCADAANLVLLRMLSHIRNSPTGKKLDELLNGSGFIDDESLIKRYNRIKHRKPITKEGRNQVRKIILLSRVTIGADVLIVSIIAQRLRQSFPAAELVLIGPPHLRELFNGLPGLKFHLLEYHRFGTMSDRICAWPLIHDLIQLETQNYATRELLIFDPDTRLTQLGLLPLIAEESTCYFDSKREPGNGSNPSLAILTNQWLDAILPDSFSCPPALSFMDIFLKTARTFVAGLPEKSTLIIISLGVGQNENKRLPEPYETELLLALLEMPETIILLDSGRSPNNLKRILGLLSELKARLIPISFITEDDLLTQTIPFSHGVVGFRGSIGAVGALISMAHGFIGYDSCCQHIASAVGTPTVIAFAGAPNLRFQERWRPFSPAGTCKTFMLADAARLGPPAIKTLVKQMTSALHTLISAKHGTLCK